MKTEARVRRHSDPDADSAAPSAPGRTSRTQRHVGRLDEDTQRAQHAILDAAWGAPVQLARDGHSGLDDGELQSAAAHGISGGGGTLPHLDAIQRSFGAHDVSAVSAHVGGAARDASHAMGAHGYATGNHVAFADTPSLFLAAHEAAHVVQQRAGVQLSSAVGQAGDCHEQHADAVAARVVAGESAEDLLGPLASGAGHAIQRDATPTPVDTVATAGPVADAVATTWFIDFWGVGNDFKKTGRGARKDGDVLVLDDLKIGPKKNPYFIKHAGDALSTGASRIGSYQHPKGSGTASALASYAKQSEIDVSLTWEGQKKGETNAKAAAAAKATVDRMIHDQVSISGDWDWVESEAQRAALEHFADKDTKVDVSIKWKGKHERHPLDAVDYHIAEPSTGTLKVNVPTTTTTAPWSVKNKVIKKKVEDKRKVDHSNGQVDVEGGGSHRDNQNNKSDDSGSKNTVDTTSDHKHTKTRTEREFNISREKIEETASHFFELMIENITSMFSRVGPELEKEEGKEVEVESEDRGLLGKAWDAVKSVGAKAVDFVTGKVVDIGRGAMKVLANKWIRKALKRSGGVWTWIVGTAVGYGVDWVAKKIKGKIKVDKKPDTEVAPPPSEPDYPTSQLTHHTNQWRQSITNVHSSLKTELQTSLRTAYEKFEETDHRAGNTTKQDGSHGRSHGDEAENTSGGGAKVKVGGGSYDRKDNLDVDATEVETETHGTKTTVTAGVPVLSVAIKQEGGS